MLKHLNASSRLKNKRQMPESQLHFVIGNVQHWNHYGESASETLICCPKLITHYFKVNFPYYRYYNVQKTWNNDNNLTKWSKCFKNEGSESNEFWRHHQALALSKMEQFFLVTASKIIFYPMDQRLNRQKCIKYPNPSIMWESEHWLRINYTHMNTIDHKNSRTHRFLNTYSVITRSNK